MTLPASPLLLCQCMFFSPVVPVGSQLTLVYLDGSVQPLPWVINNPWW